MAEFVKYNANPFTRSTKDCPIRAIVAGTAYGYKTVCDMLGIHYFMGTGNIDGVPFGNIDEMAEKTKLFKSIDIDITEDFDISPRDMTMFSKFSGFPLSFWMDNLHKTHKELSRMLFLMKSELDDDFPLKTSSKYHMVYGNVKDNKFYDLGDSSGMIVMGMYQIDNKKRAKPTDTFYFKTEAEKLRKDFEDYKASLRKKNTVKESEGEKPHPECKIAIYINQGRKDEMFLDKLFDRTKTVETRKLSIWKKMKKIMGENYKGQAILFINNKKIQGYGILEDIIPYNTEEEFYSEKNQKEHLVPRDSKYKFDQPKVGLRFSETKKIKPIDINPGPNSTKRQGYIKIDENEDFLLKIELD